METQKWSEWGIVLFDLMPYVLKYCSSKTRKALRLTSKKFVPMCKDLTWRLLDKSYGDIKENKLVESVVLDYRNNGLGLSPNSVKIMNPMKNIKQLEVSNTFCVENAPNPMGLEHMIMYLFKEVKRVFPELKQFNVRDIPFEKHSGMVLKSKTIKKYIFHSIKLAFEKRKIYIRVEEEIEELVFVLDNLSVCQVGQAEVDKMKIIMDIGSRNKIKNLKVIGDVSVIVSDKIWKKSLNNSTFLFVLFGSFQYWE